MAVQDEPTNGTQMGSAFERARSGAQPAASAAPAVQAAQPQQARGPRLSFLNTSGIINRPMARNPAGEVLTKLTKALDATLQDAVYDAYEVKLIPIDMNDTVSLTTSVIAVAAIEKNSRDIGVAYHILILEASAEPVAARYEQIGGNNVEVLITIGDAYNAKLREEVAAAVGRSYPQMKILSAGATVVPRDFKVDDEKLVHDLGANATYADAVELERNRPGWEDLNLSTVARDATLQVRTQLTRDQVINVVGQPIRRDISIDLNAIPVQQNQQDVARQAPLARISGYLDLVYNPVAQPTNAFNAYAQQQVQAPGSPPLTRTYVARFVMTDMESVTAPTLGCQLLTLAMAASLNENNSWVKAFEPQYTQGQQDLHDFGAVGIEVNFQNPGQPGLGRIDTQSADFGEQQLMQLVAATVAPGLMISLDVEEVGPSSWINGIFPAAASGHPGANAEIYDAAMRLTNGAFAKYFPQGGVICYDEDNKIHMGTWVDSNGVKRDLRDWDYLAVLNTMGERDPVVVKDFSDTFTLTGFPLLQRLAARKRIITGLASGVNITGFARRVTFSTEFIVALAKGCLECGLDIKTVAPYTNVAAGQRGVASYAPQTQMPLTPTGLFNRGGYATPTAAAGNRAYQGARWF